MTFYIKYIIIVYNNYFYWNISEMKQFKKPGIPIEKSKTAQSFVIGIPIEERIYKKMKCIDLIASDVKHQSGYVIQINASNDF